MYLLHDWMYCSHHVQEVCNCTKTLTQWAQLQTFHLSVFHLSCHASPSFRTCNLLVRTAWLWGSHFGALSFQVSCTHASHFSQPMQLYQITCTLTPHQITSSDGSSSGLPSFCTRLPHPQARTQEFLFSHLVSRLSCVWQTVPLQKVTPILHILHIVLPLPADSWRQSQTPTHFHLDLRSFSHLSSNIPHLQTPLFDPRATFTFPCWVCSLANVRKRPHAQPVVTVWPPMLGQRTGLLSALKRSETEGKSRGTACKDCAHIAYLVAP